MSVDGNSNCNADGLAGNLIASLLQGTNFNVPTPDLSGSDFQAPDPTDNPLYGEVSRISEADLTTRVVNGTGVFDGLMQALNAHLTHQYDKGRLTGSDYASVYVQLTQAALSASMQFLAWRDQTYWQNQLIQKQARQAEIAAVESRVALETGKVRLAAAQMEAYTISANYALSKLRLSIEDAQYCQVKAQTAQIEYQTANLMPAELDQLVQQTLRVSYERDNVLPAEVSRISAQTEQIEYQTSNLMPAELDQLQQQTLRVSYERDNILPAEVARISAQTSQLTFETENLSPAQLQKLQNDIAVVEFQYKNIMPTELMRLENQLAIDEVQRDSILSQIAQTEAQTSLIGAEILQREKQTDLVSAEIAQTTYQTTQILPAQREGLVADNAMKAYQTSYILPAQLEGTQTENTIKNYQLSAILPEQRAGLEADNAIKDFQLSAILPAQLEGTEADTAGKLYNTNEILPAQLFNLMEQGESNRAKTLDTRQDGVPVAGAIGKQKELHAQQVESYKRDAESKVAKMLLDAWITQKSLDEGLSPPESLTDVNINEVMNILRTNLQLVNG